MIERVFHDERGEVLLPLYRMTHEQALFTRSESFSALQPAGSFEEVPGLGRKVFVGERRPRAGQIEISLGTYGKTHEDAFALQRELLSIAPLIAAYSRSPGGTMEIAGVSEIKREFRGSAQFGGAVTLTLECASPYFWQEEQTQALPAGRAGPVVVGGMARTGLRVRIRAGEAGILHPSIHSDAGLTRWLGLIPPGGELVIDNLHGGHLVTLFPASGPGVTAHLKLTGPFPYLDPGIRTVTVDAPEGDIALTWKEGLL